MTNNKESLEGRFLEEKREKEKNEAEEVLGEKAVQEILNNPDVTKETDPEKRKEKIAYYIFQERMKKGIAVIYLDNRFGKFNENSAKAYCDWDWFKASELIEREKEKEEKPVEEEPVEEEPIEETEEIKTAEEIPEKKEEVITEERAPVKEEPVEKAEEIEAKEKEIKSTAWGPEDIRLAAKKLMKEMEEKKEEKRGDPEKLFQSYKEFLQDSDYKDKTYLNFLNYLKKEKNQEDNYYGFKAGEVGDLMKELTQKIEDIMIARKFTEIVINSPKVKSYEELKGKTKEEEDKLFKEKVQEVFNEVVTHGRLRYDYDTGKTQVLAFTDTDASCAIGLLRLGGVEIKDKKNIEYVAAGEFKKGKINIDTGGKEGIVTENIENEVTFFIDHHPKERGKETSSTELFYKALTELDLLKKNESMDKLVKFVTQMDNLTHPGLGDKNKFEKSDRTLLGLYRFMKFENLLRFFKDGRNPEEILDDKALKRYGLKYTYRKKIGENKYREIEIDRPKEQKDIIKKTEEELKEYEKQGFIIDTHLGKFVIDIGGEMKSGLVGAVAYGCNGYLNWNPKTKSFFLTINPRLERSLDINLSQGKKVRGTMYIKPMDGKELKVTLGDIINQLVKKDFKPEGKLKEYLEKEKEIKEKKEKLNKYLEKEKEREYEVLPVEIKDKKTGKTSWVVKIGIIDHLGKEKIAFFPPDFEPKKDTLYKVKIVYDSDPGENKGAWKLEVVGEYEKSEIEKYLEGEKGKIYEVLPKRKDIPLLKNKEEKKEMLVVPKGAIKDHLGNTKLGLITAPKDIVEELLDRFKKEEVLDKKIKVKIVYDSKPGEDKGTWVLEIVEELEEKEIGGGGGGSGFSVGDFVPKDILEKFK